MFCSKHIKQQSFVLQNLRIFILRSTFRQNRRQCSNNPNKKEVLNVNISYENNKFFLENF